MTSAASKPETPPELGWLLPSHRPLPAEALPRIAALCAAYADPFQALFAVLATHPALPRDLLARAILQRRPDLADLQRDDIAALLVSIVNGGRQGFDAVLRSRRKADRKAAAAMWMGKDD